MKYILADSIALRSWRLVPFAFYVRGEQFARGLKEDEFRLLLNCDGTKECEDPELAESLVRRGMLRLAKDGDTLSDWQRYRDCDNRYMPLMNLQLTAKCNFNCIHCFNAVDNAPLHAELSFEEILRLLDGAEECGVNALLLTGGEPMLHPRFMDVIREIYRRNMFVFEINTNGYFITQTVLDELKAAGCGAMIKISFDGLGYHDWMRGRKGAQEDALRAVRLCVDNGFRVMIQYNLNRKNLPTLHETLNMLDGMGVSAIRVIPTTKAPRWEKNAAGQSFETQEFMDIALETAGRYAAEEHHAELHIWQVCSILPGRKAYRLESVMLTGRKFRDTLPLCKGIRGMIAVGANGQVYPCLQMSGWFDEHGTDLGNVKRDGLKTILQDSAYLDCVCQTVRDRCEKNGKCGNCRHLPYCHGGCPALAILGSETGDMLAPDPLRCCFYENGYYERFVSALDGYRNLTVMPEPERI